MFPADSSFTVNYDYCCLSSACHWSMVAIAARLCCVQWTYSVQYTYSVHNVYNIMCFHTMYTMYIYSTQRTLHVRTAYITRTLSVHSAAKVYRVYWVQYTDSVRNVYSLHYAHSVHYTVRVRGSGGGGDWVMILEFVTYILSSATISLDQCWYTQSILRCSGNHSPSPSITIIDIDSAV